MLTQTTAPDLAIQTLGTCVNCLPGMISHTYATLGPEGRTLSQITERTAVVRTSTGGCTRQSMLRKQTITDTGAVSANVTNQTRGTAEMMTAGTTGVLPQQMTLIGTMTGMS